ncbi:MAG TPA: hypothetical protein VG929_07975 [Actinomycetota bacterium]|nr:hypothetical protein [Actinomycetota bacterium]
MVRVLLLVFVALFVVGCASDEEPVVEGPDEATTAALAELEERIVDLEGELSDADAARDRAQDGLAGFRKRFRASLKDLRAALGEVRSTSSSASDEVDAALAEARAVAADLEVLEERYNYHLRRYHGGG